MGSDFPVVNSKELLKILEKLGFFISRSRGSHFLLKNVNNPTLRITLPMHGKDLKRGTLKSILNQANITLEEFKKLRKKR